MWLDLDLRVQIASLLSLEYFIAQRAQTELVGVERPSDKAAGKDVAECVRASCHRPFALPIHLRHQEVKLLRPLRQKFAQHFGSDDMARRPMTKVFVVGGFEEKISPTMVQAVVHRYSAVAAIQPVKREIAKLRR